jgi:nucleotide-binding universal stress UspA family protein
VAERLLRGRDAVVCHVWLENEEAAKVVTEGVELARSAGLDAQPLTPRRETKTWRAILQAAERTAAGVVVCGAHGMSGVGRALLGSVSTSLVHHSPVPTLVVPQTAREESIAGAPLLCYDGSDGARAAISAAREVLRARSALVFHCWESWAAEALALAGISSTVQGMAVELDEAATERSKDVTGEGVLVAERAGFDAEEWSERAAGPIWMAALDAADRHGSGVIVVGSRGLTGISAALGSVSNAIVHHSRRPVLVVPPNRSDEA